MSSLANQLSLNGMEKNFKEITTPLIGGAPKLQLSNGYSLIFDQVSRILGSAKSRNQQGRITRADLIKDTGLSDRQIENLCSMMIGIGLIKRISYKLLPLGIVITEHDRFFEDIGTLWVCHYRMGSNARNLVWQRFINNVIYDRDVVSVDIAINHFDDLRDEYSEKSFRNHLPKEIYTIINSYTEQAFARLRFFEELEDDQYRLKLAHAPIDPLIFLFTIFDYRNRFLTGDIAIETPALIEEENSPGRVLDLQGSKFRDLLNQLHKGGYISIERQHDLDQIILSENYSALQALQRYYAEQS